MWGTQLCVYVCGVQSHGKKSVVGYAVNVREIETNYLMLLQKFNKNTKNTT